MPVPVKVVPLSDGKIHVTYDDGVNGEVDAKKALGGFVFDEILSSGKFESVSIDKNSFDICWENGAAICKNATYKKLELINLLRRLKIDIDKL